MDPVSIGVTTTAGLLGLLGLALSKGKRPRVKRAGDVLRKVARAVLTLGARK